MTLSVTNSKFGQCYRSTLLCWNFFSCATCVCSRDTNRQVFKHLGFTRYAYTRRDTRYVVGVRRRVCTATCHGYFIGDRVSQSVFQHEDDVRPDVAAACTRANVTVARETDLKLTIPRISTERIVSGRTRVFKLCGATDAHSEVRRGETEWVESRVEARWCSQRFTKRGRERREKKKQRRMEQGNEPWYAAI